MALCTCQVLVHYVIVVNPCRPIGVGIEALGEGEAIPDCVHAVGVSRRRRVAAHPQPGEPQSARRRRSHAPGRAEEVQVDCVGIVYPVQG